MPVEEPVASPELAAEVFTPAGETSGDGEQDQRLTATGTATAARKRLVEHRHENAHDRRR
jgi:hypothetical protein